MLIQTELEQKLRTAFAPTYLELSNESHLHGGAPRDPTRVRESHFKAIIVSEAFTGLGMVQQHQSVYRALGDSMGKIHALALHTFTPTEWAARGGTATESPPCPKNEKGHHHA